MATEFWLVICGADPKVGAFRIDEGFHVIGRGTICDIHLAHASVSRPHAVLVRQGGELLIRDLGSQNGSFVDGKRVRWSELRAGSSLRLGDVTLDVVDRLPAGSRSDDDADDTDRGPVRDHTEAAVRATQLPPAQKRVLRLLLEGYSEKQIAGQCLVTRHTVDGHVKAIYRKFGVHSRAALAALFRETESVPAAREPNARLVRLHRA
jgi:DNA-binding CsgD family transcriptional regulator